jgi:DNA-binding transcriptional MerR regulator
MTLVTRSLSLNVIPDAQIKRLEFIASLYKRGLSSSEIADYLNERGVSSPSGLVYYPKLVWMAQSKFKRRAQRQGILSLEISQLGFTLMK